MAKNLNKIYKEVRTFGQKLSDGFTSVIGTWPFIVIQTILLIFWVILNITAYMNHWDPYPFILLNLALSMQAAYAAPIIMMSQNRQNAKDRLEAELDYETDAKTEKEIEKTQEYLHRIENKKLNAIQESLDKIEKELNKLQKK